MVKIHTLCFALTSAVTAEATVTDAFGFAFDGGLNLLQLRSRASHNTSQHVGDPAGVLERKQCPHEIEVELAAQGDKRFGCKGTLRAEETVQCSTWGEPHITATFPFKGHIERGSMDTFFIAGLFRMAAAADGSWEVQLFNCGAYAVSMAARFGKDIIEVVINTPGHLKYFVNGQEVTTPFDGERGISLDSTHRSIMTDSFQGSKRPSNAVKGSCFDDPGGQVNIDVAEGSMHNLNVYIEAPKDAVTTMANDPHSFCNEDTSKAGGLGNARWDDWEAVPVELEDSLFTVGKLACERCHAFGWPTRSRYGDHGPERVAAAKAQCSGLVGGSADEVRLGTVCKSKGVSIADAEAHCSELQDSGDFFEDCKLDYCYSGADEQAAQEAVGEEHKENPQPVCAVGDSCDPATACCNALRDQATLILDNVVQNNICGTDDGEQELRYGRALTQNGQAMDLVVKPVGEFACGRVTNDRFGTKNAEIGLLSVQAGKESTFEFSFMKSGTSDLVAPQSLMISFLDLDQGKKDKQRESVEVCGAANAITTDDTELEIDTTKANCIKVTSTTHGTGRDNPSSVEGMSAMQRARTVAFQVQGASFQAKLDVTRKGSNPRRFAFTGHPSVACVLK